MIYGWNGEKNLFFGFFFSVYYDIYIISIRDIPFGVAFDLFQNEESSLPIEILVQYRLTLFSYKIYIFNSSKFVPKKLFKRQDKTFLKRVLSMGIKTSLIFKNIIISFNLG